MKLDMFFKFLGSNIRYVVVGCVKWGIVGERL